MSHDHAKEIAPVIPRHDHCFHLVSGGHMVPNHEDIGCCFCDKRACLYVRAIYNIGHGPYHVGNEQISIQIPNLAWPHNRGD